MTIILDSSGTPREVTNWGADEIIKQRETITAQAVVIEKLREALMTVKPHVQCDPYAVVLRALAIPTDSKEVLKAWLDEVLGEPVGWLQTSVEEGLDTTLLRCHKPKKFNPEWWKFEPLFRKPAL